MDSLGKMPVMFIGHGSPMNITADNSYVRDLKKLSHEMPVPKAILVVSAHWVTQETYITAHPAPKQIYDFYGFPEELYQVHYSAPGHQEIADLVSELYGGNLFLKDPDRGIDHAAWSVLIHLFPAAKIPVLELSLNSNLLSEDHFNLAAKLSCLREKGILIIGSGNIVHNLYQVKFEENPKPYAWAVEFDLKVKECLLSGQYEDLIHYENWGTLARYAAPTNEHYLPMLYTLGLKKDTDSFKWIHESIQNASISMRSFLFQ